MATFGPVTFNETIEVQAICTGPGGTVFSPSVFIEPSCDDVCTTGPPQSSNGASSMRGWWQFDDVRQWCEICVTIEVTQEPPAGLEFWALQVFFDDNTGGVSAGHTGLQHHPSYPGDGAVNWGGYLQSNGSLLNGGPLTNPSAAGNANTMNYPWTAGTKYRYRIYESPVPAPLGQLKAWRSEITDLSTNTTTVIRDLYAGGEWMAAPLIFTESFNDCDAPASCVEWSDFQATECDTGEVFQPTAVQLSYQSCAEGGCSNTNMTAAGNTVEACTNTPRTNSDGAVLPLTTPCIVTEQPVSVTGGEGDPLAFGGAASGPVQWFSGSSPAGPWTPVAGPPATITAANDGVWWRFCCVDDPSVCSVAVTSTVTAMLLQDEKVVLPDQGTETVTFCAGCPADWEIRVLEPDDQFNSPTPDPLDPSNAQWVTVTEVTGLTCIEMAVNESWLDGQDPDTQGTPNEEFFLHIRASCGAQVQDAILTIEV